VVATTYDPATPYRGARRLVRQLENARLLTMRGDGHTAYSGESECVDGAIHTYMHTLALPAAGTVCEQQFPEFPPTAAANAKGVARSAPAQRPLMGRFAGQRLGAR
jgi:hypothetical protein